MKPDFNLDRTGLWGEILLSQGWASGHFRVGECDPAPDPEPRTENILLPSLNGE